MCTGKIKEQVKRLHERRYTKYSRERKAQEKIENNGEGFVRGMYCLHHQG
jgi:hypothetical protein